MNTILILFFLILYLLLEFLAAFCFNVKIRMLNIERYNKAAVLGAIATIIFTFLTALASLIGTIGGGEANGSMWWFIFAAATMMAIGNVLASLSLIPFNNWWNKKEDSRKIGNEANEWIRELALKISEDDK